MKFRNYRTSIYTVATVGSILTFGTIYTITDSGDFGALACG
ncbi:hypothetical protein [Streptococcus suis]|nr:hypothetical protein [Streptococcus suis]